MTTRGATSTLSPRSSRACQLVCHPDPEVRKRRYKMLIKSGVVVQNADGSLEAVAPDIAAKHVSELTAEQRACYEKD